MADLDFVIGWSGSAAAAGFRALARSAKDTGTQFKSLQSTAAAAGAALKKAQGDAAAAARKVAIEEAKLKELRDGGKAKLSQLLAAEDRLAGARRREADATEEVERATKGLDRAQSQLHSTSSRTQKLFGALDKGATVAGKGISIAGKGLKVFGVAAAGAAAVGGTALLGAGAAATAFGVKSVKMAGDFESSMRQVDVTTGVGKKGLQDLTAVAIDMGAKTSFSAQGASEAMLALAKGGMSAAQIKAGALQQTLTLATAGGLELGNAADYMVQGLSAFGLKAGDAARVSAALAGGANASTASVESMGQALSQVGAQARTAGLSIEDTVAALAAFDNAGIKGADAGTALKTMLQRLVPSTDKARDSFKDLGLIAKDGSNKFFDAKGNMKSIVEVSGLLQNALKGQTKEQKLAALATMFGSDASRAAAVLAEQGAKGLAKYVKATNDKAAAENLAKSATQGYAGAMERFKGAVETASIQAGTKLLPSVTSFVNFLSGKAIPALSKMGSDLGPAFSVGLKSLSSLGRVGVASFKAFTQGLTGGAATFKSFSDYVVTHQGDIMQSLISGGKAALMFGRSLATGASTGLRAFAFLLDSMRGSTEGVLGLIGSIAAGSATAFGWIPGLGPKLKGALRSFNEFSKSAVDGTAKVADGARKVADGIDNHLVPGIDAGARALDKFGNKEIVKARQRDQLAKFTLLLQGIPKEKRAEILSIFKKKGADEAYKAMERIKDKQVIAKSKGDLKGANAVDKAMKALKDRLILAKSRGDTAGAKKLQAAINALRGKTVDGKVRPQGVGSTQKSINTIHGKSVTVAVGSRGVGAVQGSINGIRGRTVWVTVKKRGGGVTVDAAGGTMGRQFLADGGTVRGVGGPRQDNIATIDRDSGVQIAWTSVGEELINARQSALHRRQLKQINAGGKWDLVPRLAGGGSMRDLLTVPRRERLVGVGSGGTVVHNHYAVKVIAPNFVGSNDELARTVRDMMRRNRWPG